MKYLLILLPLISYSAYSQTYSIPTGGKSLTVKTCSGKVYDNGGFGNVIPETDGSITITPAQKGKIIKIEIDTLDMAFEDSLFIYQGSTKNKASLIGIPRYVFSNMNTPIYYGNEKDGSITLQLKTKKDPWGKKGFSALISCIDKTVSIDFSVEKIQIFKGSAEKNIGLYMLMPAQKEKAPAFKINIYFSKDKVIDKSDVMAEPTFVNNLGKNSFNLNADTKIPNQLAAGDYYIIAELDPGNAITETDEKNNIAVSEIYKVVK